MEKERKKLEEIFKDIDISVDRLKNARNKLKEIIEEYIKL